MYQNPVFFGKFFLKKGVTDYMEKNLTNLLVMIK